MIVYDEEQVDKTLLFAWLHARTLIDPSMDFRAIGYVNHALQLIGVVGYNMFIGRTATIHFATDDSAAITRGFVRETFRKPFEEWGLEHLLGVVNSHNVKALRFDLHLGFREVHRIPGGHEDGGDLVVLQMDKVGCPWLKGSDHGQEDSQSTRHGGARARGRSEPTVRSDSAELREPTGHHQPIRNPKLVNGHDH